MAVRPTWQGHLGLSLVTCTANLRPATTESERISFYARDLETHNRVQGSVSALRGARPWDPSRNRNRRNIALRRAVSKPAGDR
jgi:hypothetical protein